MAENYFDDNFDRRAKQLLEQHHVPGMTVVVVDNGEILIKSYGHARLPDISANENSLWHIGSLTKAMLAAGVGQVMYSENIKQNQVYFKENWATRIKDVLPNEFVVNDEYATANITIEDALSHRTGLDGAEQLYGNWLGSSPRQITRSLRHLPPLLDMFRAVWRYNNLMYSVVADALETVTNMPWSKALDQYLWRPLGMASTFAYRGEIPPGRLEDLALGYFWLDGAAVQHSPLDTRFLPEPYLDFAGISPAGSVISSGCDIGTWMKCILATAAGEKDALIDRKLFTELTTPRVLVPCPPHIINNSSASPWAYSLGWGHVPSSAGLNHPIIAHAGGLTGFGSKLFLLINDNFGCATLGNTLESSHEAGEALCLELMSRRLCLADSDKATFVKSLSNFPVVSEVNITAEDRAQINEVPEIQESAEQEDLESIYAVTGSYQNPAYGYFSVCKYHESKRPLIIYQSTTTMGTRQDRERRRQGHATFVLQAMGGRSWHNRFLIYPSKTEEQKGCIHFDMELITVHGNINAADEKPSTSAAQSGSSLDTQSCVWQSESTARHWSVFQKDSAGKPVRMGLRLGNSCLAADRDNTENLGPEVIWFERR